MSRSHRHSPVAGTSRRKTNQPWKSTANRSWRRAVKLAFARDDEVLPLKREITNVYDGPKDGTTSWWTDAPEGWDVRQPTWKAMMK